MKPDSPWQESRVSAPATGAKTAGALAAALLSLAAGAAAGPVRAADALPGYHAIYEATYQGRAVGEAEFSLTLLDAGNGTYEFRSSLRYGGIYRLIAPRPPEESSEFMLEDGRIQPLTYTLLDRTRGGEDSFDITFDWQGGQAFTTAGGTSVESPLVPGTLDRGSLQVALMMLGEDFAADQVTLLDREGPEVHDLRATGEETLDTPLGRFQTRTLTQQRQGSSRRTLVWLAPDLHDLPVRIERQRNGEARVGFLLKEVRWHQ